MRKIAMISLLIIYTNSFAFNVIQPHPASSAGFQSGGRTIQNPDGSNTYVTQDPSGATRLENSDGTTKYVSRDPSGATRIDNGDGTTTYLNDSGL